MASCMILNVRDTIANKIDNILFSWSAYCNRRMFEIRKKTRVSGAQWARRTQGYVFFVLMLGKQECQKEILTWSSSVQSLTCPTLWDPMNCSTPDFPVHHQLLELAHTHRHWVSDILLPSGPLSSPSPPAFNLSQHQGLFQWLSSSHQVAKVLKFGFSISPSSEYSGLISFWMEWLDLLAVQGTLKILLQHHSSKASIIWCSAFFIVELSPYMTTVMYGCELLRLAHTISCLDLWNSFPVDLFLPLYLQTVVTLSGF